MNVAVSSEENPASTRCRDRCSKKPRTGCQPSVLISPMPCACAVVAKTFRNSAACLPRSWVDNRPFAEAEACWSCSNHLANISLRRVCRADTKPFEVMRVLPDSLDNSPRKASIVHQCSPRGGRASGAARIWGYCKKYKWTSNIPSAPLNGFLVGLSILARDNHQTCTPSICEPSMVINAL